MNFRGFLSTADQIEIDTVAQPVACSYCGGTEFTDEGDNGRVDRVKCQSCDGTMTSDGRAYQPDLIGSPHNHPKQNGDPASGGVPGVWAPVLRGNDLGESHTRLGMGDSNWRPGIPMPDPNNPEHARMLREEHAGIDGNDLATSPTITRGMILTSYFHPDVAGRISRGEASAHDLLHHIDSNEVGAYWHGHHKSLEEGKQYAWHDPSDHVGHEVESDSFYDDDHGKPSHLGSVGVVLEAHRPKGWDPNKNPDDGMMGNSYLAHPTTLALHKIHYNDHHGNWHHADATGHTVHTEGHAQGETHYADQPYPDYEGADHHRTAELRHQHPCPTCGGTGEEDNPADPGGECVPCDGSGVDPRVASLHTAMPSRKHTPPAGLHFTDRAYQPGEDEHEDMNRHNPGWDHRVLHAHLPERPEAGYLEYSVNHDHDGVDPGISVNLMGTHQNYRSRGIASAMQDHLRDLYPEHVIDHGPRSVDGEKWWSQYEDPAPHLDVDNPEYVRHIFSAGRRTADVDWCRHRYAGHCWLPRNASDGDVALYTPQDRGVCPWTTASMQQINCPLSEPGPLAGMTRAGALAAAHALYNHDDGICVATETQDPEGDGDMAPASHEAALRDPELRLHLTATWADVRNKAKRIRAEGGVHIVVSSADGIGANVQGDTGIYETILSYRPGSFKVASWQCGCAWAAFAFNRSPAFKRFEGRLCSHALALQFEAQARGMFGKTVTEDVQRPSWLRDKARQRYLPDTGEHVLVSASRNDVYPDDHGLDLLRPPVYAFAVTALSRGADPAAALQTMLDVGLGHTAARALLREALADPLSRTAGAHCPDCGSPVPAGARVCPHCHAVLSEDDSGLHMAAKDDDAPTHAGLALKAADTGRVLMLQRSNKDEDDPARGTWEWPGGGLEPHDHNSLHGALREFAEEVGQPVPPGGTLQHVHRSGPYVLHTMVIPSEDAITLSEGRIVPNPDDPDGDDAEQAAWWEPEHAQKNPALREECKLSPWKAIREASRGTTAVFSANDPLGSMPPNDPPAYSENMLPSDEVADQQNPASTGFATSADPSAFQDAGKSTFSLPPLNAELHNHPEPALPSTDGGSDDDVWDTYVDPAHQHVPLDWTMGRPDPTDAMPSDISPTEMMTPNQVTASVDDIVARFQATAGGKTLAAGKAADDSIAQAARAHLSKTALKDFTPSEQAELINEGRGTRARNLGELVIEGTHYQNLEEALQGYDNPDDVLIV